MVATLSKGLVGPFDITTEQGVLVGKVFDEFCQTNPKTVDILTKFSLGKNMAKREGSDLHELWKTICLALAEDQKERQP